MVTAVVVLGWRLRVTRQTVSKTVTASTSIVLVRVVDGDRSDTDKSKTESWGPHTASPGVFVTPS